MEEIITIVVPVYNREVLLERTLHSIVEQTYRPLRLILVDNNSKDHSLTICYQFQAKHSREDFRIDVLQELKPGANAARNRGLKEVVSDWVMFFDSDDELVPGAISRIVRTISRYTQAEIIGFTAKRYLPNGRKANKRRCFTAKVEDQVIYSMISTQCFIVRTELLRLLGGWNEDLMAWQDWNMGIRILMQTRRIVWIKRPVLVKIHEHAKSITGANFVSNREVHFHTMEITEKYVDESSLKNKKRVIHYIHLKMLYLAGMYKYEKNKALALNAWNIFLQKESPSFLKKGMYYFFYRYIGFGGPGGGTLLRWLF